MLVNFIYGILCCHQPDSMSEMADIDVCKNMERIEAEPC